MKTTTIDCIRMVRRIRDTMYEKTRTMTPEELIAFFARTPPKVPAKPKPLRRKAA